MLLKMLRELAALHAARRREAKRPAREGRVRHIIREQGLRLVANLDPDGFNELAVCRSGPMVFNRHDIWIGRALLNYGEYSFEEILLARSLLKPGATIVEAGANIGAHTVELSRVAGPNGVVHAFEPQRLVFQTLCANLALNQCKNVHAYPLAVGERAGRGMMPFLDPSVAANIGGATLVENTRGEAVDVVAIDQLNLSSCHFFKADVEGMEVQAVRGALSTIEKYRPFLYLEDDRKENHAALVEMVGGLDYKMYWHLPMMVGDDCARIEGAEEIEKIMSSNLLCAPRERRAEIPELTEVRSGDPHWLDLAGVQ